MHTLGDPPHPPPHTHAHTTTTTITTTHTHTHTHHSRQLVSFGSYYAANLFYPSNLTEAARRRGLPAVVFLHPYNYNDGFYYDTYYAGSQYVSQCARRGNCSYLEGSFPWPCW